MIGPSSQKTLSPEIDAAMQSTEARLVKGAAWMTAARIITNVIGFVSTLVLARLLVPEDFGLVAIATAVGMIASSLTDLSMGQALIQHDAPDDEHFHTAWTLNFARAFLLAAIILAIAYPAAAFYGDRRLIDVMMALAGAVFVGGLQNPKLVIFQRELVFRQEFAINVADKLAGFFVSVLLAVALRNFWALVGGIIASQVARTVLSYLLYPYRPAFTLSRHRDLLSFSIWLTLSNAVQQMNWRSDPLFIGAVLPASSVGFYAMGDRLSALPIRESLAPVTSALFPAYSRIRGNPGRLQAAYMRAQGIICSLAFAVAATLAALAQPLVVVLIGEKWLPSVPIIQILSVVIAMSTIQNVQPLAMSLGKTKSLFGRDLRAFVVRFPLVIGGLALGSATHLGPLLGLVLGRTAATMVNTTWNMTLVRDIIGISLRRQLAVGLRPLVAAAIVGTGLHFTLEYLHLSDSQFVSLIRLGILAAGGLVVYAGLLGLMGWLFPRTNGPEREFAQLAMKLAARRGRSESRRGVVRPDAIEEE